MSYNKVILVGNLGRDPEIRSTQNGNKVANLSIATSERWKDRDGKKQEKTEWHRVVVFGDGLVGVIEQYCKKGGRVLVEGQLQTRKWQDQSGADRYSTEIVVSGFRGGLTLLGGGGESGQPSGQDYGAGHPRHAEPAPGGDLDSEIPF